MSQPAPVASGRAHAASGRAVESEPVVVDVGSTAEPDSGLVGESQPVVPDDEHATTLPNARRPFALPGNFEADDGYALRDGEVYYSHRQDAYFYVRGLGGEYERRWLSSPLWPGEVSTVESLPDQSLAYYREHEPIELVASGFPSVESAWYLTETVAPPATEADVPDTTGPLSVERVRSRNEVNRFLSHPLVGHMRGSVVGWKACFGLRYAGDLVAVAVLSRPSARHADDGETIELSRFASHPLRPPNTGTHLLAKAKQWAALEGYTDLISYAGVAGNEGTLYHASGLDAEVRTTAANGSGWGNRSGRDSWGDYTRRKFTESLREPENVSASESTSDDGQGTLTAFGVGESDGPFSIKRLGATHTDADAVPAGFFESDDHPEADAGALVACSPTTGDVVAACRITSGESVESAPNEAAVIAAYSHDREKLTAATNTGAWLLGQAREWAGLEGYESVVAAPGSDAHERARKRCGIEAV